MFWYKLVGVCVRVGVYVGCVFIWGGYNVWRVRV